MFETMSELLVALFFINGVVAFKTPGPLGMISGEILDGQITASSFKDLSSRPEKARLDGPDSWLPASNDYSNPWLQVDFLANTTVSSVQIQGGAYTNSYVNYFQISYSFDNITFTKYDEVLEGPSNDRTTATATFEPRIVARYVRLHPIKYSGTPRVRLEYYGFTGTLWTVCDFNICFNNGLCVAIGTNEFICHCFRNYGGIHCDQVFADVCPVYRALGVSDKDEIEDYQFDSSPSYNTSTNGYEARLDSTGAWVSKQELSVAWLRVNLGQIIDVYAIGTQGKEGASQWVKTYRLQYTENFLESNYINYFENNVIKIFAGNIDDSSVVQNTFKPYIRARFIKIYALKFEEYRAMRVEFYGCKDACNPNPCLNDAGCALQPNNTFTCNCKTFSSGNLCQNCSQPIALGMQSGSIVDGQITASSYYSTSYSPMYSRLYNSRSWRPSTSDEYHSWLQVDFKVITTVSSVRTQGKGSSTYSEYVSRFQISYGDNGVNFKIVETTLGGVKDFYAYTYGQVLNEITPVIVARYVRLLPKNWVRFPYIRLEYYGCNGVHLCLVNPCLNGGSCVVVSLNETSCNCSYGYGGDYCEVDLCSPNPCLNGGTCLRLLGNYQCSCVYGYSGIDCEVNEMIENFRLNSILPHEFGENIPVIWQVTSGVNFTVNVTYNQVLCCTAGPLTNTTGQCDCHVSDPNHFDPDGWVTIFATASNKFGTQNDQLAVEVLKQIKDVSFTILTTFSQFGSGVVGAGHGQDVFPAESAVKFNGSYKDGPPRSVDWHFDCSSDFICCTNQYAFSRRFSSTQSQVCNVTFYLRNAISTKAISQSFKLHESVLFLRMTSNSAVKIGQTMNFQISLTKLGTDTCLWVDLGDNSSLLVFGPGNQSCPGQIDVDSINPDITADPKMTYTYKSSDTKSISINHIYPSIGIYNVRLNASNIVSSATYEMVAVVLEFFCSNPNVTIQGLSEDSNNVLNAPKVYYSVPIALAREKEILCEVTEQTNTTWTIFKLDGNPREILTISDIPRTQFLVISDNSSEISISEKFLPHGFYEIRVDVDMVGVQYISGIKSLFVEIIATPWLNAAVTGGLTHVVPYGFVGFLNATASEDPDSDSKDGMSFVWYCKDADDYAFNVHSLNDEPVVSQRDIVETPNDGSGCFGSGRGRIDTSNDTLVLDTNKMIEEKSYEILLVVSKTHPEFGLREGTVIIKFDVASGVPPLLTTSCLRNCKSKVLPDQKIILTSSCSKYCSGELSLNWTLYEYDHVNQPEPTDLTDLNEVPQKEFENMAANPTNELEIAIKPHSLKAGRKYTIAFRATRPNGIFGEYRTTVFVNSPPVGGNCSVSPLSGVALSTTFTFRCENWTDPESPLLYEFSHGDNESQTMFLYRSMPTGVQVSVTNWLVAGSKNRNYTLPVQIAVTDSLGSKAFHFFEVQVLPNTEKLNLSDISDTFDTLLENEDSIAVLSLASVVASTLNNPEASAETAEEQEEEKKIIEHFLTSLSEVDVEPDLPEVMQYSGSLVQLAAEPKKLTSDAMNATLSITETLTDKLKNLSDSDKGFENIKLISKNVLKTLGGLTSGLISSGNASASSNPSDEKSIVNRTFSVLQSLQSIMLENLVTNEGPADIVTGVLSIEVEKKTATTLGSTGNELKGCRFNLPSGDAFGLGEILSNPNETYLQLSPVEIKSALFNNNPFTWDDTSSTVLSNILDIVVESTNLNLSTSNMSENIALTIKRDPEKFGEDSSFFLKPNGMNTTSNTKEYLKYHCFIRKSNYTAMNFEMKPHHLGIHYNVFLKRGGKPDVKTANYDFSYQLPNFTSCNLGNVSVNDTQSHEPVQVDPNQCSTHPYTVFVSNLDFNGTGEYCFAIQHIEQFHNETYPDPDSTFNSRNRRSVGCDVGAHRARRSCVLIRPPPPKPPDPPSGTYHRILIPENLGFDGEYFFPNQTPNYNLTMFESSCIFWDVPNETWRGEGCRVDAATNREQIVCYCNHLTSFGSDLLVAPNPIDFDSVFNNFGSLAENVAVLALISTILGLYIIGVIWARRADRKADLTVGPTILGKYKGAYHYIITTKTGHRQGAGTTARVVFKMSGEQDDTLPVWLRDRTRPCFVRGQTNTFVVSYPKGVGDLSYVQIWHDNSGSSPSWYLSRFHVKDVQTGKSWIFNCENWLAVESDDGKVCRILPVSNSEELTNFNQAFSKEAINGLKDGHIWFSIVSRPPTSNFTRVQRLSCALCLLCCTMIASAMFYNVGGQGPSPFAVHIGSLIIDLKPFVIGLQSSIIIVPVNVLLVQIFRNLRPKNKKSQKKEDKNENEELGQVISDTEEDRKPPAGKLPHYFIYVAYALCYLASATSIFFTLLYSIQWGKETSTEWVIAMVTSFFQSLLLIQPIKVVMVAVFIALFLKKADDVEDNCNYSELDLKQSGTPQTLRNHNEKELEKKIQVISKEPLPPRKISKLYRPPSATKLKKARAKRLKEIKANAALQEIFAFFVFLILLMDVAYYHRDPNTFFLTKTLFETFEEVDAFGLDLGTISDGDSLWMWSRETLIPGLYSTEWYNGKKIKEGWLANNEDYLVGVPRIRLLRVQEDTCPITKYFKDSIPHCYDAYSVSDEDEVTYGVSWEPLPEQNSRKRRDIKRPETEEEWLTVLEKDAVERKKQRHKRGLDPIMGGLSGKKRRKKKRLLASDKPKAYVVNDNALLPDGTVLSCLERWRHQNMIDLRGFPYWGTLRLYSGNGYVANLGYNPVTAYTVVADLHSNGWIDIQSRAIFVEFTVYNANTNLFGILSYFIEFGPSSTTLTASQYQAARFYLQLNGAQTFAHVMVIFFMLYFLYREGKLVYKQRLAYFKGFWNWVEVILVMFEFLLIVFFLARLYEVDRNIHQLRENPNDYVAFQYAANADALMTYVIGVLVFFYILRFLRLLRFNKNFLVIGKTLSRISSPILSFCLPFISGFFAFAMLAFTIFGTELEDYSSFMRTIVTQFSMVLGDFDFEAIFMVNPTVATLYFFSFIGLNVMVLMNMFIAIINDSYAEIQEETAEIENELEIIEYITRYLSGFFNRKFSRGKVAPKKKKIEVMKTKTSRSKTLNPFEKVYAGLDQLGIKLEIVVDIIEGSMEQDEIELRKICSVPKDKQDMFFRILCFIENVDDDEDGYSSDE